SQQHPAKGCLAAMTGKEGLSGVPRCLLPASCQEHEGYGYGNHNNQHSNNCMELIEPVERRKEGVNYRRLILPGNSIVELANLGSVDNLENAQHKQHPVHCLQRTRPFDWRGRLSVTQLQKVPR